MTEQSKGGPWVYLRSEPGLWTVGYYDCNDRWQSDSDHDSSDDAAKRCAYLNGHDGATAAERDRLRERVTEYRRRLESYADQVTDLMEQLGQLSTLQAEAASYKRDAERYRILRNSVLQAPMSAGFELLTTAADIDAQCDQLAALASSATPECALCGHPAHERYCTADECQCAFFATPERKP
jgi:hypothetical protein